jgi:hypothetical protein
LWRPFRTAPPARGTTRSKVVTDLILKHGRWPNTGLSFDTEIADWRAQREAFAAAVNTYDWHMVASVYDHLATLAATAEQRVELTSSDRSEIKDTRRARNRPRRGRCTYRLETRRTAVHEEVGRKGTLSQPPFSAADLPFNG